LLHDWANGYRDVFWVMIAVSVVATLAVLMADVDRQPLAVRLPWRAG
jgi:hypothetical protein